LNNQIEVLQKQLKEINKSNLENKLKEIPKLPIKIVKYK
jgi:hypothetical protein